MASFSGLGIGLSLVFGCLLLALVAELYYLLWWKKRVANREVEDEEYGNKYAKEFFHLICWKKPNNFSTPERVGNQETQDLESGASKDLLIKAFNGEESVESELMRLHNLAGPPRFLFTIKEETKEDLESEDGKSNRSRKGSRTRSLSDLVIGVDTPFLTPLASPRLKSPTLNPLDSYHHHGFNPLFESSMESEINRLRSSPPPKFKFLRDAEEKLIRRIMEEAEKKASRNQDCVVKAAESNSRMAPEESEGSFLGFIVGKNRERDNLFHQLTHYPSSSSQVLPLASSPTAFRPLDKKPNIVH